MIPAACLDKAIRPGRAPLRRMTRFEYSNTVRQLLGDATNPGNGLPPEELGNGFGNSADAQSVSSPLAKAFLTVASDVAERATAPASLATLVPCAATATAANQDACARTFIEGFITKAYRRPVTPAEVDELLTLEKESAAGSTFAFGLGAVIAAVLQSPDFLYRIEAGTPDPANPGLKRLTGPEMATRLSYMLWGSMPDETLVAASKAGTLQTAEGVLEQAKRLLADDKSHAVVRFFFDNLLPISILPLLDRNTKLFPTYSPEIAGYMREETQRFLEHAIYNGAGTWPGALTADYTFVNPPLAQFYGIPGVTTGDYQKVQLDTTKRLGFLLSAGLMTGTVTTNQSNPVLRGSFVVNKLLCHKISLPTDKKILDQVKVPEDTSGNTARERFSKHSTQAVCAGCHRNLDPIGFALENFDPVGLWRDQENGETINASSKLPGSDVTVNGPVELVRQLALMEDAQTCFASHWFDFGYGRSMDATGDECTMANLNVAFKKSGYDVKQLLLDLTQTDAFLYFPGSQ